ncbi:MAG: hypothetical protein C4529_14400 [Deltaproteobacteria bacterium]|nr:MAG: hypothetical protein C4529_14400 [Deltaproteobacteria bacterium]
MRRSSLLVIAMLVVFPLFPPNGHASPARADLPLVGGKPVLARINGEPLTLEEFERSLAGIHTGTADNTQRTMSHPSQLL